MPTLTMPGTAVRGVMLALFLIWLMFAMAVNWGGASNELFLLFCGNTERILQGEIWRLLTAPWMHVVSGSVGHIFFAELGLFFLAPHLETRWGAARTLRFLFFSGLIAYGGQMLFELLLPASLAHKLVGEHWFGFFPIIEAIAIAWALSFKGQTVNLMLVFPVSAKALVWFVIGGSVLAVIAVRAAPEGLISPFGGMAAGWLLGSGTPSPLRRLYLRLKLQRVEREAAQERKRRSGRVKKSGLSVIKGGADDKKDSSTRGPDGRWLN